MITILGAGGAIGGELAKLLAASNPPFRLVGRNPRGAPGATETVAADLTDLDQTIHAVAGSSVVYLLVGVKYDHEVWREVWPRVMSNTIMIRIAGWFNPLVAESYEMLYQSDSPYLFDSGKFAREFGFAGTPYADGVRATAAAFQLSAAAKA